MEKLREETATFKCNCTDPNCPFQEEKTSMHELKSEISKVCVGEDRGLDSGFGSKDGIHATRNTSECSHPCGNRLAQFPGLPEIRIIAGTPVDSKSISSSVLNLRRNCIRPDGTIIEHDYPKYSTESQSNKTRPSGTCSLPNLNRLNVYNLGLPSEADCQVDQDGTMSTGEEYTFNREAPERITLKSPLSRRKNSSLDYVSCNPMLCYNMESVSSVCKNKINILDRIKAIFGQRTGKK